MSAVDRRVNFDQEYIIYSSIYDNNMNDKNDDADSNDNEDDVDDDDYDDDDDVDGYCWDVTAIFPSRSY